MGFIVKYCGFHAVGSWGRDFGGAPEVPQEPGTQAQRHSDTGHSQRDTHKQYRERDRGGRDRSRARELSVAGEDSTMSDNIRAKIQELENEVLSVVAAAAVPRSHIHAPAFACVRVSLL